MGEVPLNEESEMPFHVRELTRAAGSYGFRCTAGEGGMERLVDEPKLHSPQLTFISGHGLGGSMPVSFLSL